MCSFLYIMLLAVCLTKFECTATEDGSLNGEKGLIGASGNTLTTTTTKAVQVQSQPEPQEEGERTQPQRVEPQPDKSGTEVVVKGVPESGDGKTDKESGQEAEEKEEKVVDGRGVATVEKKDPPTSQGQAQDSLPAEVKTTTTTAQVTSVQAPNPINTDDRRQSEVSRENPITDGESGRTTEDQRVLEATGAIVTGVLDPSKPDLKTTTTTENVQTLPKTDIGTGKEQNTLNKVGTVINSDVKDAGVATKTTTTTTPLSTIKKDVNSGQTTNPTVTKPEIISSQTTTNKGTTAGATKKTKDSAVIPQTSIAKKKNGGNAGVQPNKNAGDRETHQRQTPDSTNTITEEQKASTETSTTSLDAPTKETSPGMTSTLPKGFKIPQSVDKTDGISSVSLLFAFVTLVTFAVTAAALVY